MTRKEYTIIDWSSHLPGPYACMQLARLGLKVIKPICKAMPFHKLGQLGQKELEIFEFWYQSFNQHKTLRYYKDINELKDLFFQADGIITNNNDLPHPTKAAITYIKSSINDAFPRHDLNALASSGLLSEYIQNSQQAKSSCKSLNPPMLPWAGIELANQISQTHLWQLLTQTQKMEVGLQETNHQFYQSLFSSQIEPPYLHTGAFPCYRLYQLKNKKWVALGAIEKKFWIQFCEYAKLDLKPEDRFDRTGTIQKKLEHYFSNTDKVLDKTQNFCLSIIN